MHINSRDSIVSMARFFITVYIVGMFTLVWHFYYSNFMFETYKTLGSIVMVILYAIIYTALANLYKAFKIGAYQIGETIFSQVLSFSCADLLLYVQCCLIYNRYVNIIPGILALSAQIIGCSVWAVASKQYFIHHVIPSKTLIIYGNDEVFEFVSKLKNKYAHMFDIKRIFHYSEKDEADIRGKYEALISGYETIMLYSVGGSARTELMELCIAKKKNFYVTPRIADIIVEGCCKQHLIDTPLYKYEYKESDGRARLVKRLIDVICSVFGLIVLSPVILATAAAIRLEDHGPVFFRQKRITQDGRSFEIIKFRSMRVNADKGGRPMPCLSGDSRITKVGKVIRKFRIDEVPQIFNVLVGDMSIVGPRPECVENFELYTSDLPEFTYRTRVKAGLTGYAQIYGKYNTSPYDKLRLDLLYIENQSLLMDLRLMLLTIKILFIPESTEGFTAKKSKKMLEQEKSFAFMNDDYLERQKG